MSKEKFKNGIPYKLAMDDDTILILAVVGVGGYLIYKSNILQNASGITSGASDVAQNVGKATDILQIPSDYANTIGNLFNAENSLLNQKVQQITDYSNLKYQYTTPIRIANDVQREIIKQTGTTQAYTASTEFKTNLIKTISNPIKQVIDAKNNPDSVLNALIKKPSPSAPITKVTQTNTQTNKQPLNYNPNVGLAGNIKSLFTKKTTLK